MEKLLTSARTDAAGLRERVLAYLDEHAPALHSARLVLAASGGPDSTAMVSLLAEAGVAAPGRALLAYFDHRLRGREAGERERAAVADLASRYGLELTVGEWSRPQRSEAAARAARYALLHKEAQRFGAGAVLTGHTADDQAETVLMHAMRGARLHGLSGIAPVSPFPGARGLLLVRPVLSLGRDETRAHCQAQRLPFVDDESNEDRRYLRNRIRHDVLPRAGRDALLALSAAARAGAAALDAEAVRALIGSGSGQVTLLRPALRALSPDAVAHAYRLALVLLLGDARDFDRRHYAMLARCASGRTGVVLQLPRGVRATVDAGEVVLSVGEAGPPAVPAHFEQPLPWTGEIGGWRVAVTRGPETATCGWETALVVAPADAVLRARRPGDRIRPRGLGVRKKLQDEYVDRKVPRRERAGAPVLATAAEVLWTPFGPVEQREEGELLSVSWRRLETGNSARNRSEIP